MRHAVGFHPELDSFAHHPVRGGEERLVARDLSGPQNRYCRGGRCEGGTSDLDNYRFYRIRRSSQLRSSIHRHPASDGFRDIYGISSDDST